MVSKIAHRIGLAIVKSLVGHLVIAVTIRGLVIANHIIMVIPHNVALMVATLEVAVVLTIEVPIMEQIARVMIVAHSVVMDIKGHMERRDHLAIHPIVTHIMVGMIIMAHITRIEVHLEIMVALKDPIVVTEAGLGDDAPVGTRRVTHVDNLVIIVTGAQIM